MLGLALAAAMLFMLCSIVPSMAAITVRLNIDKISLKNASDGKVTDLPKERITPWSKRHKPSYQWICNGRDAQTGEPVDTGIWEGYVTVVTSYSSDTLAPNWHY